MERFDKPAILKLLDKTVVHEVLSFDIGHLRIALAEPMARIARSSFCACTGSALKQQTVMYLRQSRRLDL